MNSLFKSNTGKIDRIIRVIVGVLIAVTATVVVVVVAGIARTPVGHEASGARVAVVSAVGDKNCSLLKFGSSDGAEIGVGGSEAGTDGRSAAQACVVAIECSLHGRTVHRVRGDFDFTGLARKISGLRWEVFGEPSV